MIIIKGTKAQKVVSRGHESPGQSFHITQAPQRAKEISIASAAPSGLMSVKIRFPAAHAAG